MINLPTKILLAIKPMRTQFKFTLRLICTPEYKYTPEYIYTRVFFAHANWTLDSEGRVRFHQVSAHWFSLEIGFDSSYNVIGCSVPYLNKPLRGPLLRDV